MSPSTNDFNRRRPDRRSNGPGMGPGGPRDGSRGRPGRGLSDPRKPSSATFRRRGPRPEGDLSREPRRWSRDREEGPSPQEWRRGEGSGSPQEWRRGEGGVRPRSASSQERRQWRPAKRDEGPARPFQSPLRVRPAREAEAPQGESHAEAAPSELIWGRHSALAALESGRPVHRIWCTPEMRFRPTFLQLLREAKASGVLVEEVTWARLGQISGGAVHQGIVLQPAAADTLDLPSLMEGCRQLGESPLLVAVDGLTDPQNLGAILRSAEALGVHGLVLPQRRNAGLTGSVAKVAAGALEHLPVARVVNLNRALESLRQEGYRVVGLDAKGTVSLEEANLEGPLVVITGSEGQGLSLLTRRSCDQLVRIPLRGATPSLNASVATALVLYEVARRGWMQGLRGSAPPPRLIRPHMPTLPLEPEVAPQPGQQTGADGPEASPEPPAFLTPSTPEPSTPDLNAPEPSSPDLNAPDLSGHDLSLEDSRPSVPEPESDAAVTPAPLDFAGDIHL